jgi:hypothetical protein
MPDRVDEGSKPPDGLAVGETPQLGGRPPPPNTEDTGLRPVRPMFVDPPAAADLPDRTAPLRRESVYEQTILPSLGESSGSPREAIAAGGRQPFAWSPLLIVGMVSAALVVVAALLLAVGVL